MKAHGFTLVELIIVSALLMIVGGGLFTTFITGQTSYLSADAYVQVQQEARRAFDNMVRELREAGNVTPTGATNQLNFQIARGYNEAGCPNAICWGSETQIGDWVHYWIRDLDGNAATGNDRQLVRCINTTAAQVTGIGQCTGGSRVLANHVNSISFIYSGTDAITVTLQIRYASPLLPTGAQTTPALTAQVRLRNPS